MPDEPRPPRVTVVTLAQRAGVAASTVSRALRGDPRISLPVRKRIATLAAESGYTATALARSLASGRSGLIGLVLGSVENPFYAELLEEAVALAASRGLRLMMLHAGPGPLEDRTTEALLQYQVDGCLITSAELSSDAARICAARGVPVVMVNRVARQHASAVSCNNLEGGKTMADHLLECGHRRFALVPGTEGASTGTEREQGFVERVTAEGGEITLRLEGGTIYQAGYNAGQRIAALPAAKRPDAVFIVSDIAAMGAMDGLRAGGLRVPEDISVAGFDGIIAAARPNYQLTTVAQPLKAMVARGLDLLLARIIDPSLPDEVVYLRGDLVVRGSVKAMAVA
jgi:DNA-binding LacI/PurR family transcriptional regulator